jgi:hypothetical protein
VRFSVLHAQVQRISAPLVEVTAQEPPVSVQHHFTRTESHSFARCAALVVVYALEPPKIAQPVHLSVLALHHNVLAQAATMKTAQIFSVTLVPLLVNNVLKVLKTAQYVLATDNCKLWQHLLVYALLVPMMMVFQYCARPVLPPVQAVCKMQQTVSPVFQT